MVLGASIDVGGKYVEVENMCRFLAKTSSSDVRGYFYKLDPNLLRSFGRGRPASSILSQRCGSAM